MLTAVVEATPGGLQLINGTTAKAHRLAATAKGELTAKPLAARGAGVAPRST